MIVLLQIISICVAVVAMPITIYLGILSLLAWRKSVPLPEKLAWRFAIVVPAHNEEAQIGSTVESLRSVSYPPENFRVVVVADNCTDQTAGTARAAGAEVWERKNLELRGKGYALEHAFTRLLDEAKVDAIVVVDADTVVSKNLLLAFAARLDRGAQAVQAEYGVRNPRASWRTRLMTVALAMFHDVRSLARERLEVSAGLRGNGMCFTTKLLRQHPHKAYGLVEDVEYGIAIGLGGHRVWYAAEASVLGEMVASAKASESQRHRWEGGRRQLARQELPRLLRAAWAQKSGMLLDLAIDLAVPPLSYVGLMVGLGVAVEVTIWTLTGAFSPTLRPWLVALAALGLYLGRGVQLSGLGFGAVTALMWAPVYTVWKLLLIVKSGGRRSSAWVRTRRESERA